MYGFSALHTRLSDPVALNILLYFLRLVKSIAKRVVSGYNNLIETIVRRKLTVGNLLVDSYFRSLKGKRVAVIGIGVSNRPLIRILLSYGIDVCACDRTDREALDQEVLELEKQGARLFVGEGYLDHVSADVVFRTPGLHPNNPGLCRMREEGAVITSEMEAFFDVCPCKIIGVTGSDGKTTTTTLIAEMLKQAGKTVWLGGNIGQPLLPMASDMKEDDYAVVELSSFQLMGMTQSPHIAVITNLAPNHLDVHASMEEYVQAKENLYLHQGENGRLVLNLDNEITASFAKQHRGQTLLFSRNSCPEHGVWLKDGVIYSDGKALLKQSSILLPGLHNVENYMAAIGAVRGLVSEEDICTVAEQFGGVEHRIELVRELDGVRYYNDSIASSPSRTIAGLHAFDQKVILIAGGYDKQIPFDGLGPEIVSHVKRLILCGATAEKIRASVEAADDYCPGKPDIQVVKTLEEAVFDARNNSVPGDVVTLSPACAAFDQFKNFMVRGKTFKEFVHKLT